MRRTPYGQDARQTVDSLLSATERVLVRDGFAAMSTAKIAEEAGVAKATVYHYYSSKEALVQQMIERTFNRLITDVQSCMFSTVGSGVAAVVCALVTTTVDFFHTNARLLGAWYRDAAHLGDPMASEKIVTSIVNVAEGQLQALGPNEIGPLRTSDGSLVTRVAFWSVLGTLLAAARQFPERLGDPLLKIELTRLVLRYLSPSAFAVEA